MAASRQSTSSTALRAQSVDGFEALIKGLVKSG